MFTNSQNCCVTRRPLAQAVALGVLLVGGSTLHTNSAQAQEGASRGNSALLEEVVVLARKREESLQNVPIAISAFGAEQLTALKIRDLTNLAVGMPNVALDEIGTTRGTANFSIRGQGIASSILSIDPSVGVFIDGVYLGVNNGIIYDTFDLESIEVLRGPQGILFGRNVVGGAVLMNTKKPPEQFEASIRSTYEMSGEGGDNRYLMGSIGGPLSDTFSAKLTAYFNDDEGSLTNGFDGKDHGAIEQTMIRPVVVWTPSEDLELILRYEYSDTDADGPSGQSHTNVLGVDGNPESHDPDSFDFSISEAGFQEAETHRIAFEVNWSVGENGTLTNIFGWRDWEMEDRLDIDAQPVARFEADNYAAAEQFSNELRYNTLINDRVNVTTGLYYFTNDIAIHESRDLFGGVVTQDGGGEYDVETRAIFGAVDYDISEKLSLSAGLRYTQEEKEAKVASLSLNSNNPCNVLEGTCILDFEDDDDWDSWSPKVGATYNISDGTMVYAHWTRGYRSGGYNLRNSASDTVNNGPGPFDQETVTNYELGFKSQLGRARINGSMFYIEGEDVQRAVLRPDPGPTGNATVIKNAGDTETFGVELDGVFGLTDSLLLTANFGYIHAKYSKVIFDINADGVVDDVDLNLDIPRAAEMTYSVGLNHDVEIGNWLMSSRVSYAHRDESFSSDNNEGTVPEQNIVDAGIDFHSSDGHWSIALYGKNLTNDVKWGIEVPLPASLGGGTFSPLSKPRRYGVELTYNFF